MTWKLSLPQLRRAWLVFARTAPLVGILASVGFISLPASDPQPRCAALFASALTAPDHAVKGSFQCQSSMLQLQAAGAGYEGDEGIRAFAEAQGFSRATYIGSTGDGGWLYELSGVDRELLVIWTDAAGRIKGFGTATAP